MAVMQKTRIRSYNLEGGRVDLWVTDCYTCGVVFALTEGHESRLRHSGNTFYCPNGHRMCFRETAEDRERERAENAERRLKWAESREAAQRREREAAERSAIAYKGHVTRLRNRIAAGVCPVQSCRRNFANVKAHIANQHPDWAHDHPEVLS